MTRRRPSPSPGDAATAVPFGARCLRILWPAFLMAGVLEMLVFAVVDPADLRWFGGPALNGSPQAIYTLSFLMFWGAVATAGALTALLSVESDPPRG